jgi:thiamine biosynthesis lipoprotein
MRASEVWSDWSCTVRLVTDERALGAAVDTARAFMDEVAVAASRFRADSDVSRCNAQAGRMTPVSPLFVELVDVALEAARETNGATDPTVGAHLVALGYDDDISVVRSRQHAPSRRPPAMLPSWRSVRVDRDLGLVGVPPGLALDLGATAKAWTADQLATRLHNRFESAVLVEIGGDVAVAGAADAPFALRVAEQEGQAGEVVDMRHGGLTTSTTVVRRWGPRRHPAHHIIDPSTGAPARGPWRTASVWAPTAVAANTASTAAIVMGERSLPWLLERAPVARLVDVDGVVHRLDGWPLSTEAA